MNRISLHKSSIPIYFLPDERLNQFCIGIVIKAGCLYEDCKLNGYAHLYEHVVFRNLKKLFGDSFYTQLAKNGIELHAITYDEFIFFRVFGIKDGFQFASKIVSCLFNEIIIDTAELNAEKDRIKAEIREKSERTWLSHHCRKEVWKGTNLTQTIHGYCKNINNASVRSINKYRNEIISSYNVFAVVTGCVSEKNIKELKSVLDHLSLSEAIIKKNIASIPIDFKKRQFELIVRENYYTRVCISFDYTSTDIDRYIDYILYNVLFSGCDSLVYQYLSEINPLIYSFDSSDERYANIGILNLEYEVKDSNLYSSLEQVIRCLNMIKVGEFDFEANIQKALTENTLANDNPFNKCFDIASELLLNGNNYQELNNHRQRIKNVTKEAVINRAKQVFRTENIVLGIKGNKRKIKNNSERVFRIIQDLD